MMGLRRRGQWLPPLLSWVAIVVAFGTFGGAGSEISLRFVKTPRQISAFDSAAFEFEVFDETSGAACNDCVVSCKLDNNSYSDCNTGRINYSRLSEGDHMFEACVSGSLGLRCDSYNWTIDTVPPTAYVSAPMPFTKESNVSVNILFSEPCTGGGGFRCSPDYCSLLVYGAGHVFPASLKVLQPDLEFSVHVGISTDIQYGRLVLVMDKNFCTDGAGNTFTRTLNSRFFLHFDRRPVFMNIRTRIPDKLLELDGNIRRVDATNNKRDLRIYLYFSEPILNSSVQVLNVLRASSGFLLPINGSTLGNRRLEYKVIGVSSMDVVTINCAASSILSRQGTPVSASDPFTFLYDVQRPVVRLGTTADLRTRERNIPVVIKFLKPVFYFNSSSLLISGGHFVSFREVSKSIYTGIVHADDGIVSLEVPENSTEDITGNKNLASNHLRVRHYSVPILSAMVSTIATATFAATAMAAAFLTVTTASLLSSGVFSRPTTCLILGPTKNLVRIACHIQVFALSKWLTAVMPIEYYEFARGIEWSIPYINLPWESEGMDSFLKDSSFPVVTNSELSEGNGLNSFGPMTIANGESKTTLYGKPLTPTEYWAFLENQNMKPEAEFITTSQSSDVWKYFGRNMFWLAVIGGGLIALHVIFLLILRLRRRCLEKKNEFGALVCPRLEIFLLLLALPSICQASSTLIRGRSTAGITVGIILLGIATSLLISLFLFLSIGITLGKLLQYKEVHQEGQEFHWYNEVVRIFLGPGKRGQWTWRDQSNSINLARFGPLFEDLRGPPKYMLSQISGGIGNSNKGDRIIASEDENEDAEAPFIQKLFGILRIYYTLLESAKRVSFGIVAGAYYNENSSKVPTLVVLSITSFQLFFLVLKKPFIKKKVQLVEIISVMSEVGVLGLCLVLLENDLSDAGQRRVGYSMIALFVFSFLTQMINEWYALYKQTVRLSSGGNSFFQGFKTAITGLMLLVLPSNLLKDWREEFDSNQGEGGGLPFSSSGEQQRSSGERPWLRQLRELAKASFSKDHGGTGTVTDPSSSRNWSGGFWSGKRSRSSSVTSSTDFKAKGDMKAKSKGLYNDLELIFSSK
ncbi:uncharacterized protein LOC110110061 isoform X2 [Dendrobium catenatum]|uniref:Bacterial Ig-like domain-containing protein n=1 Tax=Dendrobium catenatum TaxID=906689 RepID=A0A2I0W079_9ASPA|nr:uncharacterized protein LOC110110061 isoform X2 [Dendrobium catenatum]PKU69057.1 hypothetical protein MA16_Dca002326 [Dendrobium catenatum]